MELQRVRLEITKNKRLKYCPHCKEGLYAHMWNADKYSGKNPIMKGANLCFNHQVERFLGEVDRPIEIFFELVGIKGKYGRASLKYGFHNDECKVTDQGFEVNGVFYANGLDKYGIWTGEGVVVYRAPYPFRWLIIPVAIPLEYHEAIYNKYMGGRT